ncbi:hypothetical protein GJ496_010072 [Pomphorhynchus laevis]|nr:hypothetical protein GJ496_010072 [Pomphorhynchus laevis]
MPTTISDFRSNLTNRFRRNKNQPPPPLPNSQFPPIGFANILPYDSASALLLNQPQAQNAPYLQSENPQYANPQFNRVAESALTNADVNALVSELNQRRENDNVLVAQLQAKLDELQQENQFLLQQSNAPLNQQQRAQLQVIATQINLQDQALQTQTLLEQYGDKVKQQNAILSVFYQEMQTVKDKLRDLEYAIQSLGYKSTADGKRNYQVEENWHKTFTRLMLRGNIGGAVRTLDGKASFDKCLKLNEKVGQLTVKQALSEKHPHGVNLHEEVSAFVLSAIVQQRHCALPVGRSEEQ